MIWSSVQNACIFIKENWKILHNPSWSSSKLLNLNYCLIQLQLLRYCNPVISLFLSSIHLPLLFLSIHKEEKSLLCRSYWLQFHLQSNSGPWENKDGHQVRVALLHTGLILSSVEFAKWSGKKRCSALIELSAPAFCSLWFFSHALISGLRDHKLTSYMSSSRGETTCLKLEK